MGAKPGARGNAVFVNHPQVAKTHMGFVQVVGKRKAVKTFEPTVVSETTVAGFAQRHHGENLLVCTAGFVARRDATVGTAPKCRAALH